MWLFGRPPDVDKLKAKGDVPGLIKALAYKKDEAVRRAAAEALGAIGDTRAIEPLIAAFNDQCVDVSAYAILALGRIGDPAIEPLIAALKDGDKDVRKAAVEALGKIGDARAVEPLTAARKDRDKDVRKAAAEALGKIGDARAVKPVAGTLAGPARGGNAREPGRLRCRLGDRRRTRTANVTPMPESTRYPSSGSQLWIP